MNALEIMQERFSELERLARAAGLDPYDVVFFNVPVGVIYEVASYGLPTRYSHWSFGKVYQYQKTQGEMGMSKIFELILNNNPSYAFLDKNNPNTVNLLVAAHCYAPGTCVQTTEGLKVIEDIRKGDQVYAYDGSIGKVSAPTCNIYDGEMVTIQAGSNSFTQTEDHNLYAILTQSHERRKYRSWAKAFEEVDYQPQWVEAANLKPGDFLVVNKPRRHFSITSLPTIVIEISKTHWRRKIEKSINITLDAEFGELIGLYLAEGYACPKGQMGLCFHANETELHNRSEELIKTFFGLDAKTKIRHDTSSAVVEFNEICIAAYLREMLGHSCYFKHVPTEWMENAPLDFLKGILKGFLLGDGTKCHDRDMGYTTTSALLAMQIQQIAMQCGIYFGVSSRDQSTEDQPRHISYAGLCCGIYDNKVRKLL